MRGVDVDIACATRFDLNVMVTGENGVGKRFIGERIHRQSRRAGAPFVVVRSPNAADSADALDRALIEAAPDGSVFLEEAGRMTLPMQSRLQRFIERGETRGYDLRRAVHGNDLRLITAASNDLLTLVRLDQFGACLFYRLNLIHLIIPPLRDRREDIPVLMRHFLSLSTAPTVPRPSTAAWQRLIAYPWPGNLRELRRVGEMLASWELLHPIEPDDLPAIIAGC